MLGRRAPEIRPAGLAGLADALAREAPQGALEEVRQQNQELLDAFTFAAGVAECELAEVAGQQMATS